MNEVIYPVNGGMEASDQGQGQGCDRDTVRDTVRVVGVWLH